MSDSRLCTMFQSLHVGIFESLFTEVNGMLVPVARSIKLQSRNSSIDPLFLLLGQTMVNWLFPILFFLTKLIDVCVVLSLLDGQSLQPTKFSSFDFHFSILFSFSSYFISKGFTTFSFFSLLETIFTLSNNTIWVAC